MTKRAVFSLTALLGALFVAGSLSGCFLFGGPGVSGYVFDASSGNPIANASVTISDNIGDSYTTSTNSSGKWFVSSPKQGTYSVSVSGSGFYFTTPVYSVVYTDGSSVTAQTVAGISSATYSGTSHGSFLFVLVWNGTPSPLNLHMTIPTTTVGTYPSGVTANPAVESPSWLPGSSTDLGYWNSGFGPTLGATSNPLDYRYDCNSSNTNPSPAGTPQMISNVQGGGPVTIDLYGNALLTTPGFNVGADSYNQFPGGSTVFSGVAELYVDSPTASLANLGNAVVYAFKVSAGGSTVTPLGAYAINEDASGQTGTVLTTETVTVFRINILNAGFQIVPDFKAVASGEIKSVAGTQTAPQIINVSRK